MADDRERVAVGIVARRLLAVQWGHDTGLNQAPDSADFPHLSDEQWQAVCDEADRLMREFTATSEEEYLAAYEFLTGETP